MIRSLLFTPSGDVANLAIGQIQHTLKKDNVFLWMDIDSESVETSKPLLEDAIHFKWHLLHLISATLKPGISGRVDQLWYIIN